MRRRRWLTIVTDQANPFRQLDRGSAQWRRPLTLGKVSFGSSLTSLLARTAALTSTMDTGRADILNRHSVPYLCATRLHTLLHFIGVGDRELTDTSGLYVVGVESAGACVESGGA